MINAPEPMTSTNLQSEHESPAPADAPAALDGVPANEKLAEQPPVANMPPGDAA